MNNLQRLVILPCLLLTACGVAAKPEFISPYLLATWMENKVSGEIRLAWDEGGQTQLEAVFTPDEGCHLYGKDIPRQGVDGLGRPTLLELVPGASIMPSGDLTASIAPILDADTPGLYTYPVGSVTLVLPITLPEGEGWFDEQVSITYMACRDRTCFPPVEAKIIPVRLPRREEMRGK